MLLVLEEWEVEADVLPPWDFEPEGFVLELPLEGAVAWSLSLCSQ